MSAPPLVIERIDVSHRHIDALVRCADGCLRTSASPGFAERAREVLPGIVRHSCENEAHKDFLRELADTELAHALEHFWVEIMALAGSPRSLKGETSWDFSATGRGVFTVRVEYDDDLVALGAARTACDVISWCFAPRERPAPDVADEVGRLAALRSR